MEETIVFKRENFNIAKDIRLEADVAYIRGHPVVKTKTVVLYYRGTVYRASEYGTDFTDALIKHVTRPQYVVELMNYLSMKINDNFLFEIYAKPPKEPKSLVDATFANQGNGEQGRPALFDKTLYRRGLLDSESKFQLTSLLATMNKRFSRTFSTIEKLDYIPIYGYISTSETISRISEPILHLAIVFNVLAHQDKFSGINNQEAMASFNSIMKAKRLNTSAESLNVHEYKNEIERLQLELQRERERANGLEIAKKTLEEKLDDIQSKLDASAEREKHLIAQNEETHHHLQQAQEERTQLQNSLDTANSKLDTATEMIADLKDCVETGIAVAHARMEEAAKAVGEEFTTFNVTTSSRIETFDVWSIQRLNQAYHNTHIANDDEEVLDLFCGDAEHPERINGHTYKPEANDVKLCSFTNANALDFADFLKTHSAQYPNIRFYSPKRKLIVKIGHRDEAIQALTAYSNSGDGRVEETIKRFKRQSFDIVRGTMDVLQAILDKEQANEAEKPQAIARVQEQLQAQNQRLQATQKTNAQLMLELRPGRWLFWYNRSYREPRVEEDGSVTCPVTKAGVRRYTLSERDIRHGTFREVV